MKEGNNPAHGCADPEKKSKAKVIAVSIILAIALAMGSFAGYMLWQQNQVYVEGDRQYEALSETVKGGAAADTGKSGAETATADIFDIDIDFDALEEINSDTIAWLYCPDTAIDYPVMRADDYSYYLNHLPDGTYNANGTLFLDCNCSTYFLDRLFIIYGHNMKSGKMFGSLEGYKENKYYKEHPYMYLYTSKKQYRISLIYGCVISSKELKDAMYMYPKNVENLIDYAKENTTFSAAVHYDESSKFIAMSTCSYEFEDARYVVIGVLEPASQG